MTPPELRKVTRDSDIERENSGFYLLSYRSAQPRGVGGYRSVEVRTTNPELEARARSG